MEKRLIINADDFGLCESVNKGIVEAHTKGVLTSTTIMANMPAADQAVELAKNLPTLGLGVHLNLTAGKPLSKDNTVKLILDSQGYFALSPGKLALHRNRVDIPDSVANRQRYKTHAPRFAQAHSFLPIYIPDCLSIGKTL